MDPRAPSLSTLSALLRHARRHRARVWAASACSVLNKLLDIAPEILIGIAVDVVARREQSFVAGLGITDPLQQLYLLGALTLLIWVCESLFEYLYLVLWRDLAQRIQHGSDRQGAVFQRQAGVLGLRAFLRPGLPHQASQQG